MMNFDPAKNPCILDTFTWNIKAAKEIIDNNLDDLAVLKKAIDINEINAAMGLVSLANTKEIKLNHHSLTINDKSARIIASLPDGQKVFIDVSGSNGDHTISVSPVDIDSVASFIKSSASQFAPQPSGLKPRLGIGNRQTVTVWPGIFEALKKIGGPAEIIQNSAYRELAPKDYLLSTQTSDSTYLPGHGTLNVGHTGSSIEGLWLGGVVSAIENGFTEPYGADLDHIPVKGLDDESISHAKKLIEVGRHYTFFTVDTSYLFDLNNPDLHGRYISAIEAATEMFNHIKALKNGQPFDFEFSLDEGNALTTPQEQEFVLHELNRRGVKVDFIAPNVGFEKRLDYRLPDGLRGLENRVRKLSHIATSYGALLDFHSGSDKSPATYQTISKACSGNLKLKVSGKLQLILSEVMADLDEDFFNFWWDWTLDMAKHEAELGSEVAKKYVGLVDARIVDEGDRFKRSPKDLFFTDFSFAMVGAKDERGALLYRDKFYSLSRDVQDEYTRRVKDYIVKLAHDLGVNKR